MGAKLSIPSIVVFALLITTAAMGQTSPPPPGPARTTNIPAVQEVKLKNGLTVAVVEKRNVPIVTVQMLVRSGASAETMNKAGLAEATATMLTKGTKTRTAEQVAEGMEFLGASINSGAGWNSSSVTMSVTSDKLDDAMAIMADVVLNPSFTQKELDLVKSQTLDELKGNLTQPSFLANYAATKYAFDEHPLSGTAASIEAMTRDDVTTFYNAQYSPDASVLIFVGDITADQAERLGKKFFEAWPAAKRDNKTNVAAAQQSGGERGPIVSKLTVIDLPGAGQASVNYYKPIKSVGRSGADYYSASVLNSLLGGGYSSRLNQEIRIKRGLSYGAGSGFGWRGSRTNFSTRTQTKNQSAAEVAELVIAELKRLAEADAIETELNPRRMVLTGGFGRNLETTGGLTSALADLYTFGIPTSELNKYMTGVSAVTPGSIKAFATKYLHGGDIIIVGDYSIFKDDLAKRFPNMKIEVIKADELNLESPTLRKSDVQ